MNRSTTILLIGATFLLSAAARAQTSAQAGAQASGQASVQGDKEHAQASNGVSASSSASTQSNQTSAGLSSGATFNATLSDPVDSKKSRPGDAVTARTTESVKSDGKIVLPKGTKLVGRVIQASARAKGDSESALAITFDRAILKNGQEVPLNVAIQAMASAQGEASATDADMDTIGSAGTGAAGSGMARSRGTVGGLTSTAGSAVPPITNTAATAGGVGDATLRSTVNSTTAVAGASRGAVGGLNAAGQLTSTSRGVFGMDGLNLSSGATNSTQGSMITSAGKNVHLDGGTRLLMVTQAATPNP
jgi:hypothetical protein